MSPSSVRSDRAATGLRPATCALGFLALACALATWRLGAPSGGVGGIDWLLGFLARALRPALEHEVRFVPENAPPLLVISATAVWRTVLFAAASMSLALPAGLALGVLSSSSFWQDVFADRAAPPGALRLARALLRVLLAFCRSLHEIVWALLLLNAWGRTPASAVLAVAVPYAGYVAKVFAEFVDEDRPASAEALRALGAAPSTVFAVGRLLPALPDLVGYAFYRFECAVRASAALGFFGFATIGLEVRQSFRAGAYGEVWTHLWLLLVAVWVIESWSGFVRRRIAS